MGRKLRKAKVHKSQEGGLFDFNKLNEAMADYTINDVLMGQFGSQNNSLQNFLSKVPGLDTKGLTGVLGGTLTNLFNINDESDKSRRLTLADQPIRSALRDQRSPYQGNFYAQEGGFNIDPAMLGIIESSLDVNAVSPTGVNNILQVTDGARKEYNKKHKASFSKKDLNKDPKKAAKVGDWYVNKHIPKRLKSLRLEDTPFNRLAAYYSGPTGFSRQVKQGKIDPENTRRFEIYNSAEYAPHSQDIIIQRNGREEVIPLNGLFNNPFIMGPIQQRLQGGKVVERGLHDKMIMEMKKGGLTIGMGKGGEKSVDKLCPDCGTKRKTRKQRKNKTSGEKLTINTDGLYAVDGPVVVPSRQLTFDGIDIPTMVVPLPGQDAVLEIPMGNDMVFENTNPNNISFQMGGLVEIQTENGENIAWPDGSITDVHAKLSHSRMDDDEVTDMLPEGTYIGSSYGGIKINKKDAEDIETSVKTTPYSEFKRGQEPIVSTLADVIFGQSKKKKITPAVAFDKIKNRFKQVEDGDEFDKITNELNKNNRLPYIQGVIRLAEEVKQKKEYNESLSQIEDIIGIELPRLKRGGRVRRYRKEGIEPKQFGGFSWQDIMAGSMATAATIDAIKTSRDAMREIRDIYPRHRQRIRDTFDSNSALGALNLAGGLGATFAQNPDVRFTTTGLGAFDQNIADYRRLGLSNRNALAALRNSQINSGLRMGLDPNQASAMAGASYPAEASAILQSNNQVANQIANQRLARRQAIASNNAGLDNAFNTGTANRNKQLASIPGLLSQYTGNQQNLNTANINALNASELNELQAILNAQAMRYNTALGAAGVVAGTSYNPYQPQQAQNAQVAQVQSRQVTQPEAIGTVGLGQPNEQLRIVRDPNGNWVLVN